ncbi:hypothetical protein [Thermopolyspora flexuosa]|nr:hypothetical protein [Thermopolyspora flexuosa]MDI9579124.1 hypothetical protein [Thermobispora sp.]
MFRSDVARRYFASGHAEGGARSGSAEWMDRATAVRSVDELFA